MPRFAISPEIDAMLMIRPPRPRAIIAPPMIFVQTKVLVRLRSMSVCQVSSGMSWVGMLTRRPPTLLIRMSTGPCSERAVRHARSASAGCPTSAWIVKTSRPRARISVAV